MANQLFRALNGNNMQSANHMQQLFSDVQRLKQTVQNPRAEVERLLKTGQMSQSQFDALAQEANRIMQSGAFR